MAMGARHIGAQSEIVSVPDTGDKTVAGMPSYTDGVPDYMNPFVGDDTHPVKGTFSPDLVTDTGAAQMQSPGTYPPMEVEMGGNPKLSVERVSEGTNFKQDSNGPGIDPLTGNPIGTTPDPSTKHQRGVSPADLVMANMAQVDLLRNILIEIRAQRAQMKCKVKGPGTIDATMPVEYSFQIGDKNVPALKVYVENNSTVPLCIELDGNAGQGSIVISANGGFQTFDVKCNRLSLMMQTTGTVKVNGQTTAGIVVRGWSNPEYQAMRGQA